MPLLPFEEHDPSLGEQVELAADAYVIGKVHVVGPARLDRSAVLRGDQSPIRIGSRVVFGPRSTAHVELDHPCVLEDDVWIGEDVVVHATTVHAGTLVEDGARLLSRSVVGVGSIVAAGSLVPERAEFPENSYLQGTPARRTRDTTPEERAETLRRVRAALGS